MKFSVCLIIASLFSAPSMAGTTCHWKKVRGSYWVQYNSNLENPQSVKECFYSIKKPVVLLEPFEDENEFQGLVFISDAESSEVIESCETLTLKGLNPNDEFDQNRLQNFVNDIYRSGDRSGETTTNSPKWQSYFDAKITLNCH